MEFTKDRCGHSGWLKEVQEPLKKIHIVDTMPDFQYDTKLKSMYMDVMRPTDDQRLNRSCKTGLLLRENETITGPCSLSTEGIAGAQVRPLYKFTNRGAHAFSNLTKAWKDLPKSSPKVLIPEHVNRPSNILDARDIEGTCPHPKNMKIGDQARNTDPMDPHYILPSHPEPFIHIPKFVKSSLDVGDIEGARPLSRHKKDLERASLCVKDIEGTQPGWKPFHRHQSGKEIRNLCLKVEDINGPLEERVVRPSTAEVYRDIEGSHSKDLSSGRRPGTPHTLSLRSDDIEGANAGSGSWEGTTRRKKEFAKHHAKSVEEQKDSEELAMNILTTRVQEQLKRKGLKPRDVATSFQQLDRQKSGKLDMKEVTRALKTLTLDIDQTELNSISKAFVHSTGDGYVDYWKLVQHLVPVYPQLRSMQRDTSNSVSTSMDQGAEPTACNKPCYDPAWVVDVVASQECGASDGDAGTKFQSFNSGRPVMYSKYLKEPPSKFAMQPDSCQQIQSQSTADLSHGVPKAVQELNNMQLNQKPTEQTNLGMTHKVTREVPVLSVLPESVTQPAWVNKDANFQKIIRSKARTGRGREDSIFSKLGPPESAPTVSISSSVPIVYKLNGMNHYESKPLPIGGPFWPGIAEVQPEDMAPPQLKSPGRAGPLPIGGPFWSGAERPLSAPRISLRRDYPVPPLFSEINSEINLRKAGQKERVLRTWIDRIGDGPAATAFVGEGDHVLSRPGMRGYLFNCPSSAILPHKYGHPSIMTNGDEDESRPPTATNLAHTGAQTPESFSIYGVRPQAVNSIARGSPSENLLQSNRERKLVSAMKRPTTAQSHASSARSGVTFSPLPSRPCTPLCPTTVDGTSCVDLAYGMRIRSQSQLRNHSKNKGSGRSIPVSTLRLQAQICEDMESIRRLV